MGNIQWSRVPFLRRSEEVKMPESRIFSEGPDHPTHLGVKWSQVQILPSRPETSHDSVAYGPLAADPPRHGEYKGNSGEYTGTAGPPRWHTAAALLAALAGLAYLLPKVLTGEDGLDFRLIWLAGELWSQGLDPYGPAFNAAYVEHFGPGPNTHFWVYPTYWWPISMALSALPFGTAVVVWNTVNLALLAGGAHLVARTTDNYRLTFAIGFAVAAFLQATAVTIAIGQTSILVYFGLCCLVRGLSGDRWWIAVGLLVLALKPNIGAVAFVAMWPYWRQALVPGLVLGLVSLPYVGQLPGFLEALGAYGAADLHANHPANLIGAAHLGVPVALSLGAALLIAPFLTHRPALLVVMILLFVPLHTYDLVVLAIPAMLTWWAWPGLMLALRPENVAAVSGLSLPASNVFPGSSIATAGVLLVALGLFLERLLRGGGHDR